MITDRNHAYGTLPKIANRNAILAMHKTLDNAGDACVSLVSCLNDDGTTHASYDLSQWRKDFKVFVGVNRDDISGAFHRHHSGAFVRGGAYKTFAKLAPAFSGLFNLDTTQTIRTVTTRRPIRKHLQNFCRDANSGTTLALTMCVNLTRGKGMESPTIGRREIRRRVTAMVSGLNLYGFKLSRTIYPYKSTTKTQMVTIFFQK